jgi:hypothetical protein
VNTHAGRGLSPARGARPGAAGYPRTMAATDRVYKPGERVPVSGIYVCDSGCGHRYSVDVKGQRFPPTPRDCAGSGWRLERRPGA